MRFLMFLSGAGVIALGLAGARLGAEEVGLGFLMGGLTLGGALVICGLFSLHSYWHGVGGAAFVSLLGFSRGLGNLSALPSWIMGDRSAGPGPLIESAVTLVCALLLVASARAWRAERVRRMLAGEGNGGRDPEAGK
jgi:hypothetical protein